MSKSGGSSRRAARGVRERSARPSADAWRPHYTFSAPIDHPPALQAAIDKEERKLASRVGYEVWEAYRPDGTIAIAHSDFNPMNVNVPAIDHSRAAGMVILHNHPNTGQAPSPEDVENLLGGQGTRTDGELRVVGSVWAHQLAPSQRASVPAGQHAIDVVYVVRPPAQVQRLTRPTDGQTIRLNMGEWYRLRVEPLYQKYEAQAMQWMRAHDIHDSQTQNIRHTIWRRIARETGLRYSVERIPTE